MMIVHAKGDEQPILSWLESRFEDTRSFQAWKKYRYNPDTLYAAINSGDEICGCLQILKRDLKFNGRSIAAAVFTWPGDLPEPAVQKELLAAALDYASHNCLFAICLEKNAVPDGFGQISQILSGSLKGQKLISMAMDSISIWNGKQDLYPLYQSFLSNFDSSIDLDQEQFENTLQLERESGNRIFVCSLDGEPAAFAVARRTGKSAVIKTVVYNRVDALRLMLNYFASMWSQPVICFSKAEPFQSLAAMDNIQPLMSVDVWTDARMMSRLLQKDLQSFEDVFALVTMPNWNLMF